MAMTNINIRTDEDIKAKCESLFDSLGMNMSTAVNIFLRQSLRSNGLPFDVKADVPNTETISALNEYYEMKAHPEKYPRHSSFKEAMNEVLADA